MVLPTLPPAARRLALLGVALACGPLARAQADPGWLNVPDALAPRGPYSGRIADVWWYLFIVASVVFLIVAALFFAAVLRRGREATSGDASEEPSVRRWVLLGAAITTVVLLATMVITFLTMRALAAPEGEVRHTFEIIGHQWWWEVRYDGETIGANELHVPVGEPVRLTLRSADVIHSLWIPQLAAKRDVNPGYETSFWMQADEAGTYRAVCAEFCGLQHAKMGMLVVAEAPDRFEAWLERERSDAVQPTSEAARTGLAVFQDQGCAGCHAIRGTGAQGRLGPDLTHLASRRTLAAAHLPNTEGNLAGWIVDPQEAKPGNLMPPQDLGSEELQALLAYLGTLR